MGGGADHEALAVLFDLGLGQRVAVGDDLGPGAHAAESGDAVVERLSSTSARKLQNTCSRMVSLSLWKIGRVANRCLAVRKVCSSVHNCL